MTADSWRWQLVVVMAVVMAQVGATQAQRPDNCNVISSPVDPSRVDVYCNCMQQLTQMELNIYQLTIDQTSCSQTGLELTWSDLETYVSPESLTLVGAQISITQTPVDRTWESSVRNLTFDNCVFSSLPSDAFRGMQSLEEVRFRDVSIAAIQTNAFSALQGLSVVEIANSTVEVIESRAFNNLPSLEDLAIVETSISSIESEAVSLLKGNVAETRCSNVGRSVDGSSDVFRNIMGRQLTSVGNLTLPEYGTRLLLFKNNIQTVKSRAISSETLGFLIVGGNHINTLESEAFAMELFNECEISAALFVGNRINDLRSRALVGLRGRDGVAYQTFIALSNNTFLSVARQGFLLDNNLSIFSVEENHFHCDCNSFDWILSDEDSQNQRELEKELVLKATCLDGSNFISFTSSCTDHGSPTTQSPHSSTDTSIPTATPTRTSARPPVTSPVPTSDGVSSQTVSAFTMTTTVLTLLVGGALA